MIKIKTISIGDLLTHYHPAVIHRYCKACPDYEKNWSCPPHHFDPKTVFARFSFACLITARVILTGIKTDTDPISYYHQRKNQLNHRLIEIENNSKESMALISGRCSACKTCSRVFEKPCPFPRKMRYSLESLGVDVSRIMEKEFHHPLQWPGEKMPDSLYIVQALLTGDKINPEKIRKYKELFTCQVH